jgi:hypothetical protein
MGVKEEGNVSRVGEGESGSEMSGFGGDIVAGGNETRL